MNRFIAFCFLALVLAVPASASPRVDAWLARHGVDPDEARASGDVEGVAIYTPGIGERVVYAVWPDSVPRPEEADLPTEEQAEVELSAFRSAKAAAKEIARQAAKSARLKGAEKQLVKFLRDEGAIATDAVSATPEQIDAMYEAWEATLNDTQLEKKSIKYTRLLERVERAGGTEADAYYHAEQ